MSVFDVAVVGLGAMGSATAYTLARRGVRVAGIDRFRPPHALGSSHGGTRIIREAYFEHPVYVPLLRRAFDAWSELSAAWGRRPLYHRTGGLNIGPADGVLVSGALASVKEHHIPHRLLTAAGVRRLYPSIRPLDDAVALLEDRAGALEPEQCITAFLELAARHGAELRFDEPVLDWDVGDGVVTVRTEAGAIRARRLVLAAGAWMPTLAKSSEIPLVVARQPTYWFAPDSAVEHFSPRRLPVTLCEFAPGRFVYWLPDFGDGVKVAIHHEGELVHPDVVRRQVTPEEDALVTELVRRFLPRLRHIVRRDVCLYTNTPDQHFVIDRHTVHREVLVLSPCSGHGFKFAPVIGEIAADLVMGRRPSFDLSPFSIGRFLAAEER